MERNGFETVDQVASERRRRKRLVLIIAVLAISLLTIAQLLGGQPSTIIFAIALVALGRTSLNLGQLGLIGFSLIWLVMSRLSGQRELFFPFTMFLATYVALFLSDRTLWLGWLGGLMVVSSFIVIRFQQFATVRVLAVELAVATVIVACGLIADSFGRKTLASRATIVTVASLIAYGCLAI